MFEKLKPLGANVLVKRLEDQEKTAGGIIIPDSAKEKTQTGKVLATGTGHRDMQGNVIPLQVQVGDTVYYGRYSGTQAGDDHLIIKEDEILGVIKQ